MPPVMVLDCPHCPARSASIQVCHQHSSECEIQNKQVVSETVEVTGPCPACNVAITAQFILRHPTGGRSSTSGKVEGQFGGKLYINGHLVISSPGKELMKQRSPEVPKHLPANVESALLDAENCRINGLLNPAAAFYGKAIDRAASVLLGESVPPADLDRMMLGHKIARLSTESKLPEPMIEWIKLVNDGRRKGIHREEDEEIRSIEDLEPYRRFALLLLQYLFSLPTEINHARGLQA